MRPKILRRKHYLYCQNQSKVFFNKDVLDSFFLSGDFETAPLSHHSERSEESLKTVAASNVRRAIFRASAPHILLYSMTHH